MVKNKGFTLVELLVVIAIIALLMSILMPALSRAKTQAREVMCKSKLKQWGAVFSMYANDNKGLFMGGWMGYPPITKAIDQWPRALSPYYLDQGDLRLCPNATRPASEREKDVIKPNSVFEAWGIFREVDEEGWAAKQGDYGSYGMNAWCYNPVNETTVYPEMKLSRWRGHNVRNASSVPLFGDCWWMETWPEEKQDPPQYPFEVYMNINNSMQRCLILRHSTHLYWLFLDYSINKVDLKQLWVLKWHRTFDTCGPWTKCGGVQRQDWPVWMRDLKPY